MAFLKYFLFAIALLNTSCQLGYITKSGYYQAKLLWNRQPIEDVLKDPGVSEKVKSKLTLAKQAKDFAQNELSLKPTKNYESYVSLDDRYVTYAVTAAPPYELKNYLWKFPIVGEVPYKGFFKKEDALDEEQEMKGKGYDTYIRGISAYSTLGWFNDPLLSSMIGYEDEDLVNTVVHETVHATIYIKNAAEFNERLATFLGNKGTELFYIAREGGKSPTVKKIADENSDDLVFSRFISNELKRLETFYRTETPMNPEKKERALAQLKERFEKSLRPQLKSKSYLRFSEIKLNNAFLMGYKTYMNDLSDFEKVFANFNGDFKKFLEFCKSLEGEKDPAEAFKQKSVK
ncbi:MAG: aminopeptidase [Proteobacteria bacterium SG_bin7]|nr:MAG: aminopeptidase [Proteobacteria bacterium SG_bin7]